MDGRRRTFIIALSGAALVPLRSLSGICARAAEIESQQISPQDLQKSGEALRAALQQKYQELRRSGVTDYRRETRNAFTQLVTKYITAGVSFDDAETILRHAGFSVRRPILEGKPDINSAKDWYVVLASIDIDESFLFRATIYVELFPRTPGDYTTVEKVTADLLTTMP